jgi:prolyl oligopeptidase
VVSDPYRWLERGDDPEVLAWMDAQDRYARAALATPDLAAARTLVESVLHIDESRAPIHRNGRYFYKRWLPDRGKAVVQWKQGEAGAPQMLFDPNSWPSSGALGEWWPSPDGKLVVYVVREHNADEQVLRVRDVDAGTDLPDTISGLKWTTPSWSPDGKGFYYRWLPAKGVVPETERRGKAELRYHALGTDPAKDALMFPATGKVEAHLDGFVSDDGHWLFATIDLGWTETAVHVRDLRDAKSAWRPLISGVEATY